MATRIQKGYRHYRMKRILEKLEVSRRKRIQKEDEFWASTTIQRQVVVGGVGLCAEWLAHSYIKLVSEPNKFLKL